MKQMKIRVKRKGKVSVLKNEYRQAFTEVNEILKIMPIELVNKIPIKFRELIEEEKDNIYLPDIKEPIEKCNLKNETIIILGLIYRDFLCQIEERKKLQEKDARELQEVQRVIENEIKEKNNPDNIFKNSIKKQTLNNEETCLMVVHKEKWYKKIFKLIKKVFYK